MQGKAFGAFVAATVSAMLTQGALAEDAKSPAKAAAPAAGKCVHNCSGHAECKGNDNNSCKGKNDCANQGLVPKACSSQKSEDACKKVVDAKKESMCSWYTK